ncbi:hypothetical protein BGZ76_009422 [Entomortierella beljakovae]|nr:hypothetical protein BGZ76_009422 [Entomortierella beljakovae]
MENYHRRPKSVKSKFEDDDNDSGNIKSTNSKQSRTHQHGVMVISPNGKIRSYVSRALEILAEADSPTTTTTSTDSPSHQSSRLRGVLTIKAQGRSITKAVTVAEILKRRLQGSLHQFTEIGQITEQEIWDPNPDAPNLDPLTISRHRPTIRIRLSKNLDSASSTTAATSSSSSNGTGLVGVDPNIPGALIPRDEHEEEDEDDNEDGEEEGEAWPGAILDRDAAVRRFVGYQPPTGNDIYI